MKQVREDTFAFLEKKEHQIRSERNQLLHDGSESQRRGLRHAIWRLTKSIIGRVWQAWPTKVRVTVGTQAEMLKFQAAVSKIMA